MLSPKYFSVFFLVTFLSFSSSIFSTSHRTPQKLSQKESISPDVLEELEKCCVGSCCLAGCCFMTVGCCQYLTYQSLACCFYSCTIGAGLCTAASCSICCGSIALRCVDDSSYKDMAR